MINCKPVEPDIFRLTNVNGAKYPSTLGVDVPMKLKSTSLNTKPFPEMVVPSVRPNKPPVLRNITSLKSIPLNAVSPPLLVATPVITGRLADDSPCSVRFFVSERFSEYVPDDI